MTLLFSEGFDSSVIGAQFADPVANLVPSVGGVDGVSCLRTITSAVSSIGRQCVEMKVVGDGTTAVYRSELTGDGPGVNATTGILKGFTVGDEVCFGFSSMCGKDNDLSTVSDPEIIFQFHISQAPGGVVPPPFALEVDGNVVYATHRYSSVLTDGISPLPITAARVPVGTVFPGVWTRWEVRFKLQHTGAGITQVKRDGRLVYSDTTNPNHYNNGGSATRYFKVGAYLPGWKSTPPANGSRRSVRTWYVDDIKVGTAFDDVSSSVSQATPPRPSALRAK